MQEQQQDNTNGTLVKLKRTGSKPESPFLSRSLSAEVDQVIRRMDAIDSLPSRPFVRFDISSNGSTKIDTSRSGLPSVSINSSTTLDTQDPIGERRLMPVMSKKGLVLNEVMPLETRDQLGYTMNVTDAQNLEPFKDGQIVNGDKDEDIDVMKQEVLAAFQSKRLLQRDLSAGDATSDAPSTLLSTLVGGTSVDSNAFEMLSSELGKLTQQPTVNEKKEGEQNVKQESELMYATDSTVIRSALQTQDKRRMTMDTRANWRMQTFRDGSRSLVPIVSPESPYRDGTSFDIDWEKDISFHDRGFLGQGTFGKVYRGAWQDRQVVAKVLKPEFQDELDRRTTKIFETELEIMCRAQHDNIVSCYGGCKRPHKRAVIMEYMDKGSLDTYIHKKSQSMKLVHYFKIIKSVAKALNYLHPTIVHLDIKPQNILLNSKGMVKVADFGLSRFKETSALSAVSSSCNMGTAQYIAPEMLTGTHRPTYKLDIYALGVLMWEMYTGLRPWEGYLECQIAYQVMQGERPPIPDECPDDIRDMMTQCWDSDPSIRPNASDIYKWCKRMIQIEEKRETPIVLHRPKKNHVPK
eukprot:TRINITY_DN1013_c0_g1_i11.p1 TRINITY_DN1013_c0_g1~~TRINITY_DN1013_c0_g1_i11.p1  ORF type:complete len:578 (+),score=62.36 TRINITY_DN1013_c0_g1_i11:124-1857(+)